MKIALFIGESSGINTMNLLIKKKIKISYVFSIDKKYRKKIKILCKKNNIFFFSNISKKVKILTKKTDYIFSIFSRYIIPKEILSLVKINSFNIHPGLLPYYPGTNSVAGEIYNNESNSAISIHQMTSKIDAGKIYYIKKILIKKNDLAIDVWLKIHAKLNLAVSEFIKKLQTKNIFPKKNEVLKKKFFPKFIPNNGFLSKNDKTDYIFRVYRAGYLFPYTSNWGNLKFKYQKKLFIVTDLKKIKKIYKNFFIKKLCKKKDEFIINTNSNTFKVLARKKNKNDL
jgi:methionyl-tRNA formyltransferase